MTTRSCGPGGAALAAILTLFAGSALASDKYQESRGAALLEPDPETALVYLLRMEAHSGFPGIKNVQRVYLDEEPIGYLAGRSYVATKVRPGRRLLWGPDPGAPLWVDLEAGRAHLYRLEEIWVTTSTGQTVTSALRHTSWASDEPTSVRSSVRRWDLPRLSVTERGMAELAEDARDGFEKARRLAGSPASRPAAVRPPHALPHTFKDVAYRPEKVGFQLKIYEAMGALTVSESAIDFASEKETFSIPIREVRSISIGPLGTEKTVDWAIVDFGPEAESKAAGFTVRGDAAELVSTMRDARDWPRLSPMDKVRTSVERAEAFEAAGAMNAPDLAAALSAYGASDRLRDRLWEVEPLLASHLEANPSEVGALLLQARLDRALIVLAPVVIRGGKVEPDPRGPKRDPQVTLDRVLELDPGNPWAHYLKARLYGLGDPLTGEAGDLGRAIHHATLAVSSSPADPGLREALAVYLVEGGQCRKAAEVLEEGGLADHPMVRLIAHREAFPVPDGAVEMANTGSPMPLPDYPFLRVWSFRRRGAASALESFYAGHFPGLHLFESKDDATEGVRLLSVLLESKGGSLSPSRKHPDKMKQVPDGVLLVVIEVANPTAEQYEPLPLPVNGPICQVMVINLRDSMAP